MGLAKLAGAFDNSVEHRADVGWRGSDHAEDVTGAGLVGQRLREVTGVCTENLNSDVVTIKSAKDRI
jgi:hypothetical protein